MLDISCVVFLPVRRFFFGRSVGRPVCLLVGRSIGRSIDQSVDRLVCQSVGRPVGLLVGLLVDRSVCRPVFWSVCRSVGLLVDRLVGRVFGAGCCSDFERDHCYFWRQVKIRSSHSFARTILQSQDAFATSPTHPPSRRRPREKKKKLSS